MNWGHKLTLVIIAFIICMGGMVYVAYRQTNDMVDDNYYEKEMQYQSIIDAAHNLTAISNKAIINQDDKFILVQIPPTLVVDFNNGTLVFMKIDDQTKDLSLPFLPDSAGLFLIDKSKLSFGRFKVRIKWKSDKKSYYREENLIISK